MRRVLAVVVAVGLIGFALVLRSRMNTNNDNAQRESAHVRGTLVCATEVAPACKALQATHPDLVVRVEEAGDTMNVLVASGFSADAAHIDAWLAPQPYIDMVNDTRGRNGLGPAFATPSNVLARSPLAIAIWNDRLDKLRSSCGGNVDWKCIGTASGSPWVDHGGQETWGPVKPGHGIPTRNATGLLTFAQASGQQLGRPNYASNDLTDSAYLAWVTQFEQGIPSFPQPPSTPLDEMASKGVATFDLAGTYEAGAAGFATSARGKDKSTILYPSPVATMDMVAVPMVGSELGERVAQAVSSGEMADAFVANGWRVEGRPPSLLPDAPATLPTGNGLPAPGVLESLMQVWKDAAQ